jgi:hypothetical protein
LNLAGLEAVQFIDLRAQKGPLLMDLGAANSF